MKIRNGFVSNSSSSSFIIDIKDTSPCPTCGRKGITLETIREMVDKDYDGSIYAVGVEDVLAHVKRSWYFEEDEDRDKEVIEKIKAASNPICLSISYHNEYLIDLLNDDNDIEVLYGEC